MDDDAEYLKDVFEAFGPITVRSMFGGYGVYHDGLMFALVHEGELYLKVDEGNRGAFEQAGLSPFEYIKGGRRITMSYYQAPPEMLENPELAADWASRSYAAAIRSRRSRPAGRR
jgi:DNA transformation protein